ncbi:hypothetical protein [Corallococcus aberystwythensis]|uniref:Uncharacterized protein n=1 Tax=Corallococcus aberystwythensis TaxID=2316722 RepID=A0A3A8Q6Q4_9BACT|nr:hypothetical protein [Corallococcus aberystwythensis]RKH64393.1 hypothetical protein D7W81_18765 [Corallococcus aberystwythensis]
MSPRHLVPWLLLVGLMTACASSSPAERPGRSPPPAILFQSPLALLLEHHPELVLTTDQLIQLGQREEALDAANRPLREELRRVWYPEAPPADRPPPGAGMPGRNGPVGLGGRPAYRASPRAPTPPSEEGLKRQQALLQAMEDNETAALRDAEGLLDETQKVKARELVAKQREERLRAREAMQAPEPPPAP